MLDIEPIESQVMRMLLAGDHSTLEVLRGQFDRCSVADRDFTGVGFYTWFNVPAGIPRIESETRIVIGDVCADVDGLDNGCGFLLFVEDGVLAILECHTWGDGVLSENDRYTRLYYVHQPNPPGLTETKERDMESLKSMLTK